MKQVGRVAVFAVLALRLGAAWAEPVRAAVGVPLQKAEALIGQRDYAAALAQVARARSAGHLTAAEALLVAQVDGAAAAGAGAYTRAAADYQTVLAGGVPASQDLPYIQAIAGLYDQAGDAPRTELWVAKYIAAGGTDPRTRLLLAQAYYAQGDYAKAEQAAQRDQAAEGRLPDSELQLLASAADKAGDPAGYGAALLALLRTDPSPQSWNAAIAGVTAQPGFPDRLTLDVDRLRLATGTLTDPGDFEDYTERAILAGDPAEAHRVIERGFALGILTAQTDAGHAARLRVLAAKLAVGGSGANAQAEKASDPDAALDLGIADDAAGNEEAAEASLRRVAGSDPDAALARLWLVYVQDKAAGLNGNG